MTDLVPNPKNGDFNKRRTLLSLAEKRKILRVSMGIGLSLEQSIDVLKNISPSLDAAAFPQEHYPLLR